MIESHKVRYQVYRIHASTEYCPYISIFPTYVACFGFSNDATEFAKMAAQKLPKGEKETQGYMVIDTVECNSEIYYKQDEANDE